MIRSAFFFFLPYSTLWLVEKSLCLSLNQSDVKLNQLRLGRPRFPALCFPAFCRFYFEFSLALKWIFLSSDWPLWLLWFWFYGTQSWSSQDVPSLHDYHHFYSEKITLSCSEYWNQLTLRITLFISQRDKKLGQLCLLLFLVFYSMYLFRLLAWTDQFWFVNKRITGEVSDTLYHITGS